MKHYSDQWVEEWCQENGWTELFIERQNHYWAFPPGAVIPEPIPTKTLKVIKSKKGLSEQEKIWLFCACIFAILAAIVAYLFQCPIPLMLAFSFAAITALQLEIEE